MPLISSVEKILGAPGAGTKIPRNTGALHQNAVLRSYTLRVDIANRHLNFSYNPATGVPPRTNDLPLDMRVYEQECQIELLLAADLDWYFPVQDDVIILGDNPTVPNPEHRYVDLDFDLTTPKCKRLWFYATRYDAWDGSGKKIQNTDRISIQVVLDQDVNGRLTSPLYLYIDPGIKNPGDGL